MGFTWNDLTPELQQKANELRAELRKSKQKNTKTEVLLYNEEGTFYLYARRRSSAMSYGWAHVGWSFFIGRVKLKVTATDIENHPLDVELYNSTFTRFTKTADGTEIPQMIQTKKEVVGFIRKHFPKSFTI